MDPLAHTLFGATLAETGLKERSRYATAVLIVGANLPDIDALAMFVGGDFSLYWRRGWTHGVLAMVVLPLLLCGGVALWHRWRGRRRDAVAPRWPWLIGLAYLAVLSHPLLDWMNTYGVRLLMPFDGSWFYGDTLFIVDPWFWLLTAGGVVLARSRHWLSWIGWLLLAALTSWLMLATPWTPWPAKVLWAFALLGLVIWRWRSSAPREQAVPLARVGVFALTVYVGLVFVGARLAESEAMAAIDGATLAQANPAPAVPWRHRMVVATESRYHIMQPDGSRQSVARRTANELVQRAMSDPSVRGFMNWSRFLVWEVREHSDGGATVIFRDLRYVEPEQEQSGIGLARVELTAAS